MRKVLSLLIAGILLLAGCNTAFNSGDDLVAVNRAVSGPNGSIDVSGMSKSNLTVTYNAGKQLNYARLYVSEGNGTGLVLAARDMKYSNGVYTHTLKHTSFKTGAKIYLTVLKNDGGTETCVPQGVLSNTTSWASITYGTNANTNTSTQPATGTTQPTAPAGSTNTTTSSGLTDGAVYKITAQCSGKVVDVSDVSKEPGANVHQWEYVGGENQKWKLLSAGDGYWYVQSVWSGLVLDGNNWGTTNGTNILQWHLGNNQANQKWKIEENGDGTYRLMNLHANLALDVVNGSKDNGANIQLWAWNGSSAQRWTFTRLDEGSNNTTTPDPNTGSNDQTTPSISGYRLVWADEFNGNALDQGNWSYDIGTGEWGWGNNEQQYYTNRSQNISVSDGSLKITALRENYNGSQWTSARIHSKGKKDFTYGKITARIKLPNGTALWPAFWMLGSNFDSVGWPKCGEIDIMEHVNSENVVHGHIHWDVNGHADWGLPTNDNYWNNFTLDVTQWHEYTIDWDVNAIKWYVDGVQFMEADIAGGTNGTDEFHKPFYFLLNLAVGGQWPGYPTSATPNSSSMYVDYIRVYQK